MSLLAPLYIAGLLAVSLPILFHLIRRAPQGRQAFSSLMFLSPSPPRLTRRSRISNLLLLLLRAAALSLLAFAFARPFFRSAHASAPPTQGRRIALLVDTSASMRRGDLWTQASRHVEKVLNETTPTDQVALFFFDRQTRTALSFSEWNELDLARRQAVLRARLAETGPTWSATRLGDALATVADLIGETEREADAAPGARQLVLISDMQQGSHIESLQGYQWPENVTLDARPVALSETTNAGLGRVSESVEEMRGDRARLRVRVSNQAESQREQFQLVVANAQGPINGIDPVSVYVPPGGTQVVRLPWPGPEHGADRLVLSGDDFDFDNTLFVVPPRRDVVRVVYAGDDAARDPKGLLYYLQNALAETESRTVELKTMPSDESITAADLLDARLVVASSQRAEGDIARLKRFIESGGDVLWVMKDEQSAGSIAQLTGTVPWEVTEAAPRDYALISRVELDHPLFAPFADPRFGDFTKIRFWKHRSVKLAEESAARVLATFDNGDPFLIEQTIGTGRLLMMTSGWHPADSQLALSTKFVPLIDGLVRPRRAVLGSEYDVQEPIPLPPPPPGQAAITFVQKPDGQRVELSADNATFEQADQPGVYRVERGGQELHIAVNLAPDESRTAPLAAEALEQFGVRVGSNSPPEALLASQRQLQRLELENQQKIWRWLLVGVLGLLAVETALAGVLARRNMEERQVTA